MDSLGRGREEREGGYISSDEAEGGGSDRDDSGEVEGMMLFSRHLAPGQALFPTPSRVRLGTRRGPHRMQRVRRKLKCSLRCKGYYVRLAKHYQSKKHGLAPQAAKQLASEIYH